MQIGLYLSNQRSRVHLSRNVRFEDIGIERIPSACLQGIRESIKLQTIQGVFYTIYPKDHFLSEQMSVHLTELAQQQVNIQDAF